MKRLFLLIAALLMCTSCADKLATARTTIGFVGIGTATARQVIVSVSTMKRAECLKQGADTTDAFKKCYETTQKMIDATDKLWPQLDQALITATAAIKAAAEKQAGQTVNYVTPIRQAVCLLTKLVTWVPEKYRVKIQQWINLVGSYTCYQLNVSFTQNRGLLLTIHLRYLLLELGAKA